MQKSFEKHLQKNFSFLYENKFIIAVSGGIDSVVLAYLCKNAKLDFAIAHCNFQLRGKESDKDESFVKELAEKFAVDFFIKKFETKKYVKENQSIQLIARKLRYDWFSELLQKEYAYLLTAHHLNDDMETFMINLLRGTGIEGLLGIPTQNDKIFRPLLKFSLAEIEKFAKQENISWREDFSNTSDDYLRNRIRHHIIPEFEKENPDFSKSFLLTKKNLQQSKSLNEDYLHKIKQEITFQKGELLYFNLQKLKTYPNLKAVLYLLFKPYNFTAWKDIYQLLNAETGKVIISKTHRLLKDRDFLILGPPKNKIQQEFFIEKENIVLKFPAGKLVCENVINVTAFNNRIAYLAENKIKFPLKLRIWKAGDKFQPFGMKGNKKISKFLKDKKVNLFEKENTWVLLSNDKIVWVIGHQIDEKFKIEKNENKIIKIEWRK